MAEAEKHELDERTQTFLEFIGAIAEMSSIGYQKSVEEKEKHAQKI